jgi:hypothetical protein
MADIIERELKEENGLKGRKSAPNWSHSHNVPLFEAQSIRKDIVARYVDIRKPACYQ